MPHESDAGQPSRVPDGASPIYECEFGRGDLRLVRTEIARHAGANGLADQAQFNFILAVNELITNAILHGGGGGCVRLWRHGDGLWCEIEDAGSGIPEQRLDRMRIPHPHERGHGLWLAHQICGNVHITTGLHGTQILLRYPLPAAQPAS
jgi:anti-sigma regulatory factor (Ser/Thr protein kinase)